MHNINFSYSPGEYQNFTNETLGVICPYFQNMLSEIRSKVLEEAEALGAFWAPMMEHMVREKTLHVYVSPMQRCLQTANPLMTRLKYHGTVYPKIFESPGLCHKSDREFITNTLEPLIMSKKIFL